MENIPKTNITGTLGGSNFTFPIFCIGIFALNGVLNTPERPPPPPFQSDATSLFDSCAVFVSEIKR